MLVVLGILALITARTGRHGGGGLTAFTGLLPSLLPIAYGYLLAHHLGNLLVSRPRLLLLLDDPMGRGWRLLPHPFSGTTAPDAVPDAIPDVLTMSLEGIPTAMIWYGQIGVILLAHAVSVLLAHRYLHLPVRRPGAGPALRVAMAGGPGQLHDGQPVVAGPAADPLRTGVTGSRFGRPGCVPDSISSFFENRSST